MSRWSRSKLTNQPETRSCNNIKSTFAIYLHHYTRAEFLPNRDPTFCEEHIFRCVMTNLQASDKKTKQIIRGINASVTKPLVACARASLAHS